MCSTKSNLGNVSNWFPGRNYGFIKVGKKSYFFHKSQLKCGAESLSKGYQVNFELGYYNGRRVAVKVNLISDKVVKTSKKKEKYLPWGIWLNVYEFLPSYQKKHVKLMMGKNAIVNKISKNIIPYWTEVDDINQGIKIFKKFRQKHPDEIFEIRLENCDFQKINKVKYEGLIIETKKAYIKYGSEGLVSVIFKECVKTINSAFYRCRGLTSVTFPEGLTTIKNGAFYRCRGLTSVTFPEGLTTIKNGAFKCCFSLTSVTFPERLKTIGKSAFKRCTGLTSVTFPEWLRTIEVWAFYKCTGLISLTFPKELKTIGWQAFDGCTGLTSVTFPAWLRTIEYRAFWNCTRLTTLIFPAWLRTIECEAFGRCTGLTEVRISKNTYVDSSAFDKHVKIVRY